MASEVVRKEGTGMRELRNLVELEVIVAGGAEGTEVLS